MEKQIRNFTNLRSVLVTGGERDRRECMQQVRRTHPNVLVATPGRLIDLVENYGLDISKVKSVILDEGDMMLDMGFEKDLDRIMKHHMNKEVKSMVFSATVPKFIQELAQKRMRSPLLIDMVGTGTNQIPDKIKHKAFIVQSDN